MKAGLTLLAVAAILLAVALVFAPLAAALAATGMQPSALAIALRGIARPLAGSAETATVSALFALRLGVPFALLVERSTRGLRRAFWALGLVVLMVPPYMVGEAWIVLLGPAGKISRMVADLLGLAPHSANPIDLARFSVPGFVYSRPAVGLVMGGCLFPLVALAVASTFRRTDLRVFESARIAQGRRGVWRIAGRVLVPPALGAAAGRPGAR